MLRTESSGAVLMFSHRGAFGGLREGHGRKAVLLPGTSQLSLPLPRLR